jgi:hypothetical protein
VAQNQAPLTYPDGKDKALRRDIYSIHGEQVCARVCVCALAAAIAPCGSSSGDSLLCLSARCGSTHTIVGRRQCIPTLRAVVPVCPCLMCARDTGCQAACCGGAHFFRWHQRLPALQAAGRDLEH